MIDWLLYAALLVVAIRGAFRDDETSLLGAAFFIPLSQTLPSPIGPISAPANILVLSLLLAWWRVKSDYPPSPAAPVRAPIALMSFFILLGAAHRYHLEIVQGFTYSKPLETVASGIKEWLMAYIAYFLVFRLVQSAQTLRKMWLVVLLCAGGEVSLAIYERLQGVGRASAHLGEANAAGGYFAAVALMFLAPALLLRGRMRIMTAVGCGVAITAVFASLSRAGMLAISIGLLIMMAIFYIFVREGTSKLGVAVLIVLLLLNASLLVPQRVMERVLFTFAGGSGTSTELGLSKDVDQSSGERLAIWGASLQIMGDKPWGIGFGTFTTEVVQYVPLHKVAHNIYLMVGAELGVAALAILLILVFAVYRHCWRSFRSALSPEEAAIGFGLFGAWTALTIAVFFSNPFFLFNFSGQFWTLFAAQMKVSVLEVQEEERQDPAASRLG